MRPETMVATGPPRKLDPWNGVLRLRDMLAVRDAIRGVMITARAGSIRLLGRFVAQVMRRSLLAEVHHVGGSAPGDGDVRITIVVEVAKREAIRVATPVSKRHL